MCYPCQKIHYAHALNMGIVLLTYIFGFGSRNVPYDWINKQKSNQNWLRKEGDKFHFPGGGTMFPRGVSAYVDSMQSLIPEMTDGTIRTAIDSGCGVSSAFLWCRVLFTFIILKRATARQVYRLCIILSVGNATSVLQLNH